MADINRVRETAEQYCATVTRFAPDVLLGIYYAEQIAGRIYFDCSGRFFTNIDEFTEYQEGLLREEYYASPGALKWNLYLLLIRPESYCNHVVENGLGPKVEQDTRYARKLIVPENELEGELVSRFFSLPEGLAAPPSDVATEWMDRFAKNHLDGVYIRTAPMDRVVAKYIEGTPIRGETTQAATITGGVPENVRFINKLKLRRYRPCLTNSEFQFGRVNLIEGANGTGKTSLLEAIELWMCERSFRNPESREGSDAIGLMFEDERRFLWNRALKQSDYRRRALGWYGIHRAQTNVVHEAFNRFNFYDTDAATRLAESWTKADIREALDGLVLGEAASVVLERARGIANRFKAKLGSLEETLRSAQADYRRATRETRALGARSPASELQLLGDLSKALRNLGWKGARPKSLGKLKELSTVLDRLNAAIRTCREHPASQPRKTFLTVAREEGKVSSGVKRLSQLIEGLANTEAELVQVSEDAKQRAIDCAKLDSLHPYVKHPRAESLLGLKEQIENRKRLLKQRQEALRVVDRAEIDHFADLERSFGEALKELRSELTRRRRQLEDSRATLEDLRVKCERVVTLNEELRVDALEIVELEPDRDVCPVCGARYTLTQLRQRIADQSLKTPLGGVLRNAQREFRAGETTLAEAEKRKDELSSLWTAANQLVDTAEQKTITVSEFIGRLRNYRAGVTRQRSNLNELESFQAKMGSLGLVEEEYTQLLGWFSGTYPGIPAADSRHLEFERHRDNVRRKLSDSKAARRSLEGRAKRARTDIASIITELPATSSDPNEALAGLRSYAEWLSATDETYKLCRMYLQVTQGDTLLGVAQAVSSIESALKRAISTSTADEQLAKLKRTYASRRKTLKQRVADLSLRVKRTQTALDELEAFLSRETGSRGTAAEYFSKNTAYINDLFSLLCIPRDFVAVRLKRKHLVAIRRGSGQEAPITQLSSGQRSALALSVFLSLNSWVTTGPPYLIFDDPIAHADDLNALTFFDLLRIYARRGDRQIFFATANAKLASLFRRKFEFLGEELAIIHLPG